MTESKTTPTEASVDDYLAQRASPTQREEAKVLMDILHRVTQEHPKMWGPSIVGCGSYRYRYESGRTGQSCACGFAIRGRELVVYLMAESPMQQDLLAKLGKHKSGKSCVYLKSLAAIDTTVLEQLIAESVNEVRRRYPNQ